MNAAMRIVKVASDVAVGSGEIKYTNVVECKQGNGFLSLFVQSTAGSITIVQQCSMDGINFYDPKDSRNQDIGGVVSAMSVGNRWVQPSQVFAPYMRWKITEGGSADTVVNIGLALAVDS